MTETKGLENENSNNDTTLQIPTIAGKLDEISSNNTDEKKKVPRKILHFSDGVLEEYSTEEEEEIEESDGKEVVDPRSLTWAPWLYWRAWSAGGNVVSVLDTVGEKLAWWMGITSPKYYYEIQEAIRMKEEEEKRRKEEDAEMSGWQEQSDSNPARSEQPSPKETASTQPLAEKLVAHTKYESINDSVQN